MVINKHCADRRAYPYHEQKAFVQHFYHELGHASLSCLPAENTQTRKHLNKQPISCQRCTRSISCKDY